MQGLLRSFRPVVTRTLASTLSVVSVVDNETRESLNEVSELQTSTESVEEGDDVSCLQSSFGCAMVVQLGDSDPPSETFLIDFGGSDEVLTANCEALGIDLSSVSFAVLSNPLHDHGAGLDSFLDANPNSRVYAHERLLDDDLASFREFVVEDSQGRILPVGLETETLERARESFFFVGDGMVEEVSDDVFVVAPKSSESEIVEHQDAGSYETDALPRNLGVVVRSKFGSSLLVGCAPSSAGSIAQLLDAVEENGVCEGKFALKHLVGGIHFMYSEEEEKQALMELLSKDNAPSELYLNHCSGVDAVVDLSDLVETVEYFPCGESLLISPHGSSLRPYDLSSWSDLQFRQNENEKKGAKANLKFGKKEETANTKRENGAANAASKLAKREGVDAAKRQKKEAVELAKRAKKEAVAEAKALKKKLKAEQKAAKKAAIVAFKAQKKLEPAHVM